MQPRDLIGLERAGRAQRVDLRAPERFGRVDVPDARDPALVEQQRLDGGAAATPKEGAEPRDGERARQRLAPHRDMERRLERPLPARIGPDDVRRVDERHAPELPHVDVVERRAIGEGERGAREALGRRVAELLEREATGHPQRRAERVAAVEPEHHELPAAAHVLDAPAGKPRGDERHRLRLGDALPIGGEGRDRATGHQLRELPRDRLDLG